MAYSPQEQEHSPEVSNNFFRALSLGDIYGKENPNPARIEVDKDLYDKLTKGTLQSKLATRERFVKEHNIIGIGAFKSTPDGYFVNESHIQTLAYWVPYHSERQLIIQLASSLNQNSKPTIVEAACGSGLVSKLLAIDNHVKVIGTDPYMVSMRGPRIPNTQGEWQLKREDLWNLIEEFGPKYNQGKHKDRKRLLDTIRMEYARKPVFEHLSVAGFNAQSGDPLRLNSEIGNLQDLSNENDQQPSPIDLVLCSFMPMDVDLTVPIRDGIHPKCIVYVRPMNGMSGAGDFYSGEVLDELGEEVFVSANTAISYNPGKHYRTVARWPTHQRNDWMTYSNPPKLGHTLDAEVVIQIRNDVDLTNTPPINIEKYQFDRQLESAFSKSDDLEKFLGRLEKARAELFAE
jgi:hypothetical protein